MTSFEEIRELVRGKRLPLNGTNEDGENFIIQVGVNEHDIYFKVLTAQSNGWCRVNYYYEDGCMEEIYEK